MFVFFDGSAWPAIFSEDNGKAENKSVASTGSAESIRRRQKLKLAAGRLSGKEIHPFPRGRHSCVPSLSQAVIVKQAELELQFEADELSRCALYRECLFDHVLSFASGLSHHIKFVVRTVREANSVCAQLRGWNGSLCPYITGYSALRVQDPRTRMLIAYLNDLLVR